MRKQLMTEYLTKYKTHLMGICIIWIVLFHSGIEAPSNTVLRAIWYLFVSFGGGFGVNIFLMLSGFGIAFSDIKRSAENRSIRWGDYYKRRFLRILPAYFLVAIPYYLLSSSSIWEVLYNLFFLNFIIDGKRDFWYIFIILLCYLLFPVMKEFGNRANYRVSLCLVTIIAVTVAILCKLSIPDVYSRLEIALWRLPCFWIGCYYGMLSFQQQLKEFRIATFIFTVLGLLCLGLTGFSRNTFVLLSPAVMIFLCSVSEIIKIEKSFIGKMTTFWGKISLELYLVHVSFGLMVAASCSALFSKIIGLFAYFAFSILLSYAIHTSLQHVRRKEFRKME